jgi:hypothetical protein
MTHTVERTLTQPSPTDVAISHGVSATDVALAGSLAALTLAICLYFAPRGFHAGFVDMGHDGYQLRQVVDLTQGGVIFRDTFDQYGPLNGYLNAIGFLSFGRNLLAVKYFICLWYAVTAIVLFAIARRWLEPPLAAFSVLVWIGLAPFYNHGIMISPHAYALLFQAVATLIALRSSDFAPRRFAMVGLLAGLSWAVKQGFGVLYLLAIVVWLLVRATLRPSDRRRTAVALAAAVLAFGIVVAANVALLWSTGALRDWYLQTIEFPRRFYLSRFPSQGLMAFIGPIIAFVQVQQGQALYWFVMRGVVLTAGVGALWHLRADDDLVLMALVTAFLWLGAYPSGNFMHQWWTSSLAVAPFLVALHRFVASHLRVGRGSELAAAAVMFLIVAPGINERAHAAVARRHTLPETLAEPSLLRGIRTDATTRRGLETLYRGIKEYRRGHPGSRVVSIESSDGWAVKIETLPLLTFFDDNVPWHPVYWNLPVLSSEVYAGYRQDLWRFVRQNRPLIVDHRPGKYMPARICAYHLFVTVPSDIGHWYVFAADDEAQTPQLATQRNGEELMDYECSEDGSGPTLPKPLSSADVTGAWRGIVDISNTDGRTAGLAGPPPLQLEDATLATFRGPVDVYTWPADLREVSVDGKLEPISTDIIWRARDDDDIVHDFRPGAWTVNGQTSLPSGYVLQWDENTAEAGTKFIVRGEVIEGGLQIGFLAHGQWYGSVHIRRPGHFEAVFAIQKTGEYGFVAANDVQSPPQAAGAPWSVTKAVSELLDPRRFRNYVIVADAGWVGQ